MAVENHYIGETLDQPTGTLRNDGDGETGQIVRQGLYGALKTFARSLKVKAVNNFGTEEEPENLYVASWSLERLPKDYGKLIVNVGGAAAGDDEDEDEEEEPEDPNVESEKWAIKNVQQQLPLSRFYVDGGATGALPNVHEIAMWRLEPRKDLADAYQFAAPDGNVYTLSSESQQVAAKYQKGIENVMRFYPVITRTVTYKRGMTEALIGALGVGANLAHEDTPPKLFGLSWDAWLCIQDEGDFDADGKFVRVTGWMGCRTLDQNLYGNGADRWEPMG